MTTDGDAAAHGDPSRARRKGARLTKLVVAFVVAVVVYVGVTFVQVIMASSETSSRHSDAAIVLGAAQYDGTPSPAFTARLDHAYELYEDGVVPRVVLTGGGATGDRFTEGFAGYEYLLKKGMTESDLLLINEGTTTYHSVAAAREALKKLDAKTVTLVSDPYHSLRLRGVAGEIGLDAVLSPTTTKGSLKAIAREAGGVSLGRLFGYRRLARFLG